VRAAVRHPTLTFFLLTFLLTWMVWVPRALHPDGWAGTVGAFWSWMPAVAAVVTAAVLGRDALRDLGARLVRWRVGWQWYVLVLLGPAAFWGLVWSATAAAGWSDELGRPILLEQGVAGVLVILLVLVLTDGLGEETGWRGFALPRLLHRYGPIAASLLLGVVWALWHLPLFWTEGYPLAGSSPWVLLLELPAVAVVFTWIFQRTDGSALLAILLHAGLNLSTMSASVAGASARVTALVLILKWLVAAAIIATWMRSSRR
jgi:membrane protease YdiL (CAAX protease family)